MNVNYFIVNREELSRDGNSYELQGYQYGSTNISLILVDVPPGEGPKLHVHPYEEVFVIQEGSATYTIGSNMLEAKAGQIAIVPAGVPHSSSIQVRGACCRWTSTTAHALSLSGLKRRQTGNFLI